MSRTSAHEECPWAMLAQLIDKVAFVDAINDAWILVALMTLVALAVVPWARGTLRL